MEITILVFMDMLATLEMNGIFKAKDVNLKQSLSLLPPQGFGPEAKTRGGIIRVPA